MLWQPSLPDEYLTATPESLRDRIAARRAELGDDLLILGHHYQADAVIQHADVTGDSLKLAQHAATLVESGDRAPKWIVFAGVHFMAETADMLTPDTVSVILPDLSAGCSMADMAAYDDAAAAWDEMHASFAASGVNARIIPITYINSSAAIKAFVGERDGAVCTSGNAPSVVAWALAGGTRPAAPGELVKVLFLPDQHLGRNTAAMHGLDVTTETALYDPVRSRRGDPLGGMTDQQLIDARVLLWAGHCSVHKLFRPEHCDEIAEANASLPDDQQTKILVHPECAKEVVDKSDLCGSTEFIIKTIDAAAPGSRWAVGTEVHLVARIAKAAKSRDVSVRILSDCQCLCTTMYRIDQEHLCWVLDNLASGKVVNRIEVHPEARRLALSSLDRMLEMAPAAPVAIG